MASSPSVQQKMRFRNVTIIRQNENKTLTPCWQVRWATKRTEMICFWLAFTRSFQTNRIGWSYQTSLWQSIHYNSALLWFLFPADNRWMTNGLRFQRNAEWFGFLRMNALRTHRSKSLCVWQTTIVQCRLALISCIVSILSFPLNHSNRITCICRL